MSKVKTTRRDFLLRSVAVAATLTAASGVSAAVSINPMGNGDGKGGVSGKTVDMTGSAHARERGIGDDHMRNIDMATGEKQVDNPQKVHQAPNYAAFKGERLSEVMSRWVERNGGYLEWRVDRDWVLGGDFAYIGDFKGAVKALFEQLPFSVHKAVDVTIYSKGNAPVIRVVRK